MPAWVSPLAATVVEYVALRYVLGLALSFVSYHLLQGDPMWAVLYNAAMIAAYLAYVRWGPRRACTPWFWGRAKAMNVLYAVSAIGAFLLGRMGHLQVIPERLSLLSNPFYLVVFFLAPMKEELLYRGILLRRAAEGLGFWPGLLLSGVLFAAGHPNVATAFLAGVILGFFYSPKCTATLLTPIALHILLNLTGFLPVLPEGPRF